MKIKIYTTPTCPWSEKLKTWLDKNKISYEEHDTTENSSIRAELLNKSNQLGTPMIDIDGKIIVGFQEEEIKEAIKNSQSA